jgi:uncharacterized integral membrane protein
MRVLQGIFFFIVAFVAACVILLTFMQEPFQVKVGAKLLWYQTQAIPVYIYLAGAFVLGLLFGFVVFIYYYTHQSMTLRESRKAARDLESEIEKLRAALAHAGTELDEARRLSPAKPGTPPAPPGKS